MATAAGGGGGSTIGTTPSAGPSSQGGAATARVGEGAQPTQTAKQGQLSAGSKTIEAAITAVGNGLQGLTAKLSSVADEFDKIAKASAKTRAQQVTDSRATEFREKRLADTISKIWDDSLKSIVANAKTLNTSLQNNTTVTDNATIAAQLEAKQILAGITQRKKEEAEAIKTARTSAERMRLSGLSYKALESSMRMLNSTQTLFVQDVQQAQNKLDMLAQEVAATNGEDPVKVAKMKAALSEYDRLNKTLEATTAKHNLHQEVLTQHDAAVKGMIGRLKELTAGLTLGTTLTALYKEAQSAKTTGTYASSGEFLAGQLTALRMGVSSQIYNELNAITRGASLTAASQAEFDGRLTAATDKLSTITASREEGAKLAANIYQSTATAGISAKAASSQMDALADNFNRMSKITGKTAADMAQLTVAITQDTDHRALMLGMNSEERASYLVRMQQNTIELKQQGYSIEQATELQKIALQARAQGVRERFAAQATAEQTGYVIASMFKGPAGEAIRGSVQQEAVYTRRLQTEKLTADERFKIEQQRNAQIAKTAKLTAEAEGKTPLSQVEAGRLAELEAKRQETAKVGRAQAAMEVPISERMAAKVGEKALGEDPMVKFATTVAGYGSALSNNTLALVAASAAITALSIPTWILAKDKLLPGGVLDLLKRGGSKVATVATTIATTGAAGLAGAAGAAGAGAAGAAGAATLAGRGMAALKIAGGIAKGPGALLASLGLDYAAEKAGGYETTGGTALNTASNVVGMAGTGAMIGSVVPVVGTLVGGAVGAATGLAISAYNKYTYESLADKVAKETKETKVRTEAQTVAPPPPMERPAPPLLPPGTPVIPVEMSLEDLQRQYYQAALDRIQQTDPEADGAARDRHLQTMTTAIAFGKLQTAPFNAARSQNGG